MDSLWRRYTTSPTLEIKQKLIEEYLYLVKLVAGRLGIYLNQYIDQDDLFGYGVIGLMDAIDKYDLEKNVKFETYASLRIKGAILDAIRKLDWVPRTIRKKQKQLDHAYTYLETELGRAPEDAEIMEYLELDEKEYNTLLKETAITTLLSIEDYTKQIGTLKDNTAKLPEQQMEIKEVKAMLAKYIDLLSEREKQVITLYYFEELTLKEISSVLGVSESRISQIHTKAVARLRAKMQKYYMLVSV